jgi:NAD(P)H-flavin reductase
MSPKPESTDYRTARLVEVTRETEDASTYLFVMEPGTSFSFTPGQFNMIGFPGFEDAPISMSSLPDPHTNLFSHTIRRVGNVTEEIGCLQPDRSIMVRGPFGRGWPLEKLRGRNVVVVAGGIGLAPLRPLLLHHLERRGEIGQLTLVYGAKTPADLLFKRELLYWQDKTPISTVYCVDRMGNDKVPGLKLREGFVTLFLEEFDQDPKETVACLCGPEIMMRFVARDLIREGYGKDRIYVSLERRMRCGAAHCGHCQIGSKFVCKDGPVFSYSDISRFADTLL